MRMPSNRRHFLKSLFGILFGIKSFNRKYIILINRIKLHLIHFLSAIDTFKSFTNFSKTEKSPLNIKYLKGFFLFKLKNPFKQV